MKKIMIVGPCAAESLEQITITLDEAKKRSPDFVRVSLWKPRTKPGFDGVGLEGGLPFLRLALEKGLNPATEVLIPEQAEAILEAILPVLGERKLCLWLGARNQNHLIQQAVARLVAQDKRVTLLVKNQPWASEDHWKGLIEHMRAGGLGQDNLILCHRGFVAGVDNPHNYRNIPDYAMAMRIKAESGLPVIFDPSHTGGTVANVLKITQEAAQYDFDGMIIEVHPNPSQALSDAKQQLTWPEYDQLMATL